LLCSDRIDTRPQIFIETTHRAGRARDEVLAPSLDPLPLDASRGLHLRGEKPAGCFLRHALRRALRHHALQCARFAGRIVDWNVLRILCPSDLRGEFQTLARERRELSARSGASGEDDGEG